MSAALPGVHSDAVSDPPIRLPSGVRDFLPRAAARRRSLAARVVEKFEAWGYARIITPVFECADVLERGLGADARAAAIRFVEPGTGEIVALRPDITPQVARIVATRLAEVEGPIRLCYEGAVTRRAAEHGQREILQAGIELIDAPAPAGDAEVLAVAAAALAAAQLPETRIDVGHVAPARYVLGAAADDEARARIAGALARKDLMDRRRRRARCRRPPPPSPRRWSRCGARPPRRGPAHGRCRGRPRSPPRSPSWPTCSRRSPSSPMPGDALTVDLGDLRGFDYYTGVRFAGYAGGAADAVLRGGRYDELIGRYGRAARATGFAIDLEALAQAQRATGVATPPSPVGVAVFGPGAPAIARALRGHGVRAVTATSAAPTASWLRGAGLDAALLLDAAGAGELVRADDSRGRLATLAVPALVTQLLEERCPS